MILPDGTNDPRVISAVPTGNGIFAITIADNGGTFTKYTDYSYLSAPVPPSAYAARDAVLEQINRDWDIYLGDLRAQRDASRGELRAAYDAMIVDMEQRRRAGGQIGAQTPQFIGDPPGAAMDEKALVASRLFDPVSASGFWGDVWNGVTGVFGGGGTRPPTIGMPTSGSPIGTTIGTTLADPTCMGHLVRGDFAKYAQCLVPGGRTGMEVPGVTPPGQLPPGTGGVLPQWLPGTQRGEVVQGSMGLPAFKPGARNTQVRVCPRGTVLFADGLCYSKGSIPSKYRMHPPAKKPPITAADAKAIRQAAAVKKRVARVARGTGLFVANKRPSGLKPKGRK